MRWVDIVDGRGTSLGGGFASDACVEQLRVMLGSVSNYCSGALSNGEIASWSNVDKRYGENTSPWRSLSIDGGSAAMAVGCEEVGGVGLNDMVKHGDASCNTNSDVTYYLK